MKFFKKKKKEIPKHLRCCFCSRTGNADQANPIVHVFETLGFNDECGFNFGTNSWFHQECYEAVKSSNNYEDLSFVIQNRVKSITVGIKEGKRRGIAAAKHRVRVENEQDAWNKLKDVL